MSQISDYDVLSFRLETEVQQCVPQAPADDFCTVLNITNNTACWKYAGCDHRYHYMCNETVSSNENASKVRETVYAYNRSQPVTGELNQYIKAKLVF